MSTATNAQGLHTLATIIKRLEAATSRLEDIAIAGAAAGPVKKDVVEATGGAVPPPPPPPPVVEEPKSVTTYDEMIVQAKLEPFLTLSEGIGGVVWDQAQLVKTLFADQRHAVLLASASVKPTDDKLPIVLKPVIDTLAQINKIKDDNRSGKNGEFFNHLSTVAEGVPAVGWLTVVPKPGPYISEAKDSAQFWANRVIKSYKEKDAKHVDWARSFTALLEELRKYVMEFHTTGLTWNPKGGDPLAFKAQASPAAVPGGPPPPPPPPPPPAAIPPPPPPPAAGAAAGGGGLGAVFADLNKGESVTAGLRKVKKEDMTHKNPSLRVQGPVPGERATSPTPSPPGKKPLKPSKPTALAGKKPSKFALEGSKWIVDYCENDQNITIDQTEKDHSINLYGCKNCIVQVKGKVNAVTLANCTKTSIVVDSVISSVSITNSPSFALQIKGSAPTVQIDATDSGQIYLSKDCLGVEIMTAKCSSINVSLPVEGEEEGVFEEKPIPEMLRTTIKDGKLVTSFVEHSG